MEGAILYIHIMNLCQGRYGLVLWVVSNLLINSSKSLEVRERETDSKKKLGRYEGKLSPSFIFSPQLLVSRELSVSGDLLSGVDIVRLLASSFPVIIRNQFYNYNCDKVGFICNL